MTSFLDNLGNVLIGGLGIAFICAVWAFASALRARMNDRDKKDVENYSDCSLGCASCTMSDKCNKKRDM